MSAQERRIRNVALLRDVEKTNFFIADFNERVSKEGDKKAVKLDTLYAFMFEANDADREQSPLFCERYVKLVNDKMMDFLPCSTVRDTHNLENMKGEIEIKVDITEILEIIYEDLEYIIKTE